MAPTFKRFFNLAVGAYRSGDTDAARLGYRRAGVLAPSKSHPLVGLGILERSRGRDAVAIAALRRAIMAAPLDRAAHYAVANAWLAVGGLEAGRSAYRRALAVDPGDALSLGNLGMLEIEAARHDAAEASLRRALASDPGAGVAASLLGEVLLARGETDVGWPLYFSRIEARHREAEDGGPPLWDGRPLGTGPLLLRADGGLGDALMHARFLTRPIPGVSRVVLQSHDPLTQLLRPAVRPGSVIAMTEPAPEAAAWLPLSMLAMRLGGGAGWREYRPDYLTGAFGQAANDRRGISVGLCWRGGLGTYRQGKRAIELAALEPLTDIAGPRWISLQVDADPSQAGAGLAMADRTASYAGSEGMLRMAREMAGLDLVITVDTYVAHLAGALGLETWVLLPHGPEWRWGTECARSPWYPDARLFRQPEPGDWRSVTRQVAVALAVRIQ